MKKIFTLTLVCLLTLIFVQAQELKTYKGDYEGGQATYQYFETDEFERIYQGSFSLTNMPYNMQPGYSVKESKFSCNGNFNDGYKEGEWVYVADNFKNVDGHLLKDTFKGSYINGYKNGAFTYTRYNKTKRRNDIEINVNYRNDTIVGDFKSTHTDKSTLVVSGKLDDDGFATGTWTEKTKFQVTIMKFYDGYCYYLGVRSLQTGEIDVRLDEKENYEKLKADHWVYGETTYRSSGATRQKEGLVQAEYMKHEPYWSGDFSSYSYVRGDLFLLYARIKNYNQLDFTNVLPYFAKGSRNDKMSFIPFKVLGDVSKSRKYQMSLIEGEYDEYIKIGDDYLAKGNKSFAINSYNKALVLKPTNASLKSKISTLEKEHKAEVEAKKKEKERLEQEKNEKIKAIKGEFQLNYKEINKNPNIKAFGTASTKLFDKHKFCGDNLECLEELIAVQRKLVEFSKITDKTVEKALKKAETFEDVKVAVGL